MMNDTNKKKSENFCAVRATLDMIGGKWKLPIISQLQQHEHLRFKDLNQKITGITNRMLSKDLKDLEQHALVTRTIYPEVPPRVEYALTEKGRSLRSLIQEIKKWGQEHG